MVLRVIKALFGGSLKIHYGQWSEDVLVRKLFSRKKKDGFYLDIGAFHPLKHSNTAGFWLKGWSGINIDANPNTIKKFNRYRPKDENIWTAIVSEEEYKKGLRNIDLLLPSKNSISTVGTCQEDLALERGLSEKMSVPAKTINNILKDLDVNHIDYMNIDVEGFDQQVIEDFDFSFVSPTVISVEDYSEDINALLDSKISKILQSNNYNFIARAGLTSIFQIAENS